MSTTRPKRTREEVAKIEVGQTDVSRGIVFVLVLSFLGVIYLVPIVQTLREKGKSEALDIVDAPGRAAQAFSKTKGSLFGRLMAADRSLLGDIDSYEDGLEEESFLTKSLVPPAQLFMARYLGAGNENAYLGRDHWLFYRPGLDYLTGPGFLDLRRLARRVAAGNEWTPAPQPDPRRAILDFRDQLALRGIALVLMPIPVKPGVHPERFSKHYEAIDYGKPLRNVSFEAFVEELRREGVLVCTLDETLGGVGTGEPRYLATDTHWRPKTMAVAAQHLADFINENIELLAVPPTGYQRIAQVVSNQGDVARMMQLPEGQTLFPSETVEIQQIRTSTGDYWHAQRSADILMLGDSFSNIYSLGSMEWGTSAGLAEQLSFVLQRPLDRIVRNDAGAFATREALSRDLARGRDRLEGKRVVIWEFAERELAVGDWKMLDLTLGTPKPARFIAPEQGRSMVVTGIVEAVSHAPRPGSVPYRDHIIAVHLRDVQTTDGAIEGDQALVYMWSMRDNIWTDAARLRERQRITVRLTSWYDVADRYETINRAELEDESLQFEDPCWGELVSE